MYASCRVSEIVPILSRTRIANFSKRVLICEINLAIQVRFALRVHQLVNLLSNTSQYFSPFSEWCSHNKIDLAMQAPLGRTVLAKYICYYFAISFHYFRLEIGHFAM